MNESDRYVKIVEWSGEEQCYIGSAPGLLYSGCHGDDEQHVFARLCEVVDEAIALYLQDCKPLTPVHGESRPGELVACVSNASITISVSRLRCPNPA